MAATLSLDTLTSGGSGITVLAGKTLTVEGVSVTAGSSNIQRATTDVTIGTTAGYEVAGKSEVVVAANAASSNRTITLPAVGATGMSTCIITVVADADATSTYLLKVQDAGTTEVWTGYQTGDFVRLIVSNSAWVVVDHKETYYSRRYLTANQVVAHSSTTKLTGWTNTTEIGNTWDNANDKLVTPTGMNGYWAINFSASSGIDYWSGVPVLYLGGAVISKWNSYGNGAGGHAQGQCGVSGEYYATSTQAIEFYGSNAMNGTGYGSTGTFAGSALDETHFTARFNRVY
jgi:hypothetical protein